MKKLILSVFLSALIIPLFAQLPISWCNSLYHIYHGFNFDFNTIPDSSIYYIQIDTNQLNNIWQTGTVNKPYFSSGSLGPRALVTDTVHPYPVNNISSFTFSVINCPGLNIGGAYRAMTIQFNFSINSDSLQDGGTVEVSHNNGLTWTNAILDTSNILGLYNFYSNNDLIKSLGKPGFSGTYKNAYASIIFKPRYPPNIDTVSFKFTFGSDSIQTNKDGWMVSDIYTKPEYEGINEKYKNDLISIFPNPAQSEIFIKINYPISTKSSLQLENIVGQNVQDLNINKESIKFNNLLPGIYFVKYHDGKFFTIKKAIVIR